ncbi:hypothetical protein LEP1GSC132_4416 [Leptospira kirschneri str. 200803703]|uniref:Uncharacterized protein n=1 Tax=Leptospira kirschneri str. 200802841 TaxID=1193047 RepID=A0A828XSQ8_9LEPT|nr:hypothetical protein LEP1GSC044_1934 [Leptospira kirschneri serovar Grippotyphosa str. RM52]EKO50227.1 hypothetical protein LEP1GSC131_2862 [Leptospira kirschneri str. 200802841]EKP05040.1 hypothetical protein LEP1GSC018_2695 [Leptospira kirschneri str. 2008720114]EKQ82241.1 hypothetical protein LEP1GSC064_4046 [Leptospira kirschneri serovar Grippotyphosa str. Moskva]EKR06990.1 hypothetical protein LEP1GSC122_3573 [Leptospira kirschneri serovar Valbuzzi str. 200702274]EMJ85326.1 hypothetica
MFIFRLTGFKRLSDFGSNFLDLRKRIIEFYLFEVKMVLFFEQEF